MRFVFYNLQVMNYIAKTLWYFLVRRPYIAKHSYILEYLKESHQKIFICRDTKQSSFLFRWGKYIPKNLELFFWALINKIKLSEIEIIESLDELKSDDVLFTYIWMAPNKDNYSKCKALKLAHASHIMHGMTSYSDSWRERDFDYFIAENNLTKNAPFFDKFFSWYKKDVYTLPHVFEDRFIKFTPFSSRKNKAIATGTTFKYIDKDFNNFFQTQYYHPMRQIIFDNKEELKELIDCFIEPYLEKYKDIFPSDSRILRKYKEIYNLLNQGKRQKYFSFDIVKEYNDYKMAIIPEEVNNIFAIGVVECMACGCAYLGIDDPMYRDIGLIPMHHYISYDGTLDDLKRKIIYYQRSENQGELEIIADAGYRFVIENFNSKVVAKTFYKDLEKMVKNREFLCSFANN